MVSRVFYFIVLFAFIAGCNKSPNIDCEDPDYSSCNTEEPLDAGLHVIITKRTKTSRVPVTLYQGKFGAPEKVVFNDTIGVVDTIFILPLNHDYYAIAKYENNLKATFAVDGDYFQKYSNKECDSVCWSVKGDEIDVRLKN